MAKKAIRVCARCETTADRKSKYCAAHKAIRKIELREKARLTERQRRSDPAVREKQREIAARYRRRYPEKIAVAKRRDGRRQYLKRVYGLTPAEIETMTSLQGGVCGICRLARPLHVDHDHETGSVRGLLCGSCNRGIGQLGECVDRLRSAVEYLDGAALIHALAPILAEVALTR
jgi:hypothetical protein